MPPVQLSLSPDNDVKLTLSEMLVAGNDDIIELFIDLREIADPNDEPAAA